MYIYSMNEKKYIENLFLKYDKNIKLDEEQIKVIMDDSDSLMVIAGAGSGKTTTIAAKVKFLVDIKKINPKEILIISLTNKAVEELQFTINQKFLIDAPICTFHKLAFDLIKEENRNFKILSDPSKIINNLIRENNKTNEIIKLIMKDYRIKKISKSKINLNKLLSELLSNNIKLIKTLNCGISLDDRNDKKTRKYFEYLNEIYFNYKKCLAENNLLDFEDIILLASKLKINRNYRYVIVDEYQDISENRYRFLKKILDDTKSKVIVVGDDFQTIFSFAGSNLNQFINFSKNSSNKIIKINKTYRNSQELVDIAGQFVMQDKNLIRKNMLSNKRIDEPIKIYGTTKNSFSEVFTKVINEILENYGNEKTILVLGRYKNDILKLNSKNFIIKGMKITYIKYPNLKIDYLTIHSSKGLGYDNVILININNEENGFPSKIRNDIFTKKILGYDLNYEEERRLMYVAMTRTKNRFYIISEKKNESEFLKEIIKNNNVYIDYKIK